MASIKPYQKGNKTFYLAAVYVGRDELTGKPRYKKKRGFESQKEANLWASRLTVDASQADLTRMKNVKFEVIYKQWFDSYKNTVRPSTWLMTQGVFNNHIIPLLGSIRLDRITTSLLQKVVNKWAASGQAGFKMWFFRTKAVLKYARKQGYLLGDPAEAVIVPKVQKLPNDEEINFWDRHELEEFFKSLDPIKDARLYTAFRVLAFSGMRRGECLALTWDDVSFSDNTISISKTISVGEDGLMIQPPKSAAGNRVLAMDEKTMSILRRWRVIQIQTMLARGINTNKPGQLVFSNQKNELYHCEALDNWLRAYQKAHHVTHKITVHGFRHSHASALFAAGASMKEVQVRLGHEDVQTTMNIYTHVTKEQNEQAADKVANYLNF